jgi:hypothetical protein
MLAMLEVARQGTGIECHTDLEAHIASMQRLGINNALTKYLASSGIDVVICCAQRRSLDVNKLANAKSDHELALSLGREALMNTPDAQGLLLLGGLWYAIYAVPILEAEFGKPVSPNLLSATSNAMHTKLYQEKMQGVGKTEPYWGRVLAS